MDCRWVLVFILSVAASNRGLAARAQSVPAPTSTAPSAPGAGPLEDDRLRRLEEMNRQLIDQVRALSQQCETLSKQAAPEDRLGKLEEANKKLVKQVETLSKQNKRLSRRISEAEGDEPEDGDEGSEDRSGSTGGRSENAAEGVGAEGTGGRTNPREARGATSGRSRDAAGERTPSLRGQRGIGAEGTEGRVSVREADVKPARKRARVDFAEGLEFHSSDDEFTLTFHNLTQAELRAFGGAPDNPLHTQFFIPRQRWYFTGQVRRNIQYYTSINRGYGSLDLLDAFITYNVGGYLTPPAQAGTGAEGTGGRTVPTPNTRFRIRVGRTKTPYLYEYYEIAEGDLIAPERSLYAGNLAGNRQIGIMTLGDLFQGRLGYHFGVFNGPRRSFEDFNSAKDLFLLINTRPFLLSDWEFLRYLNVGGSFDFGYEDNPTQPGVFRTANDQTPSAAASTLSPTFFEFNNNVRERGERTQWAAHLAYYYKSLGILAEYAGSRAGYAITKQPFSTPVPFEGYMVQAFYFLTGEQITRRVNVVRPRNLFGFNDGRFGWGAFEVHSRFSALNIGHNVFTSGFADPNLWSNNVYDIDVGFNWYLNYYTKIYFDWQHAVFGSPVYNRPGPGGFQTTSDLFWLRFQLFF